MKRKYRQIISIFCILFTGLLATACSLTALCPTPEPCPTTEPSPTIPVMPSIVGTWEGLMDPTLITFKFEENGDFIFLMNSIEAARGQYAILDTIVPKGLIIVYDDGTVLYPIFTFIDNETLQIENALPGQPRPVGFSDYLIMTRSTP